jgi:hypothetical protein
MMRSIARWSMVALAVVAMIATVGSGPRNALQAHATQPDVYQVSAGSAAFDVDGYQTGCPVDPAPCANTAIPLTSVGANNQPQTVSHAAYVEPPTLAQSVTNLNNVPVPYATQTDALCANCGAPVVHEADGNFEQDLNGRRISTGAGRAHSAADKLAAVADASNGQQTIGSPDQLTNLYNALVSDVYSQVVNRPGNPPPPKPLNSPPPCQTLGPAPSPYNSVCPSQLPQVSVMAQTGASESHSAVSTDTNGTTTDTWSDAHATQLLDGLISIALVRTEVKAVGDGTDAGTKVVSTNEVAGVCAAGNCGLTITSTGICAQGAPVCSNDPLNQSLRQAGFNVCRLSTATGQSHTTATGDAQGIVLEWHLRNTPNGGSSPDPDYYRTFGGACEAAPSVPHGTFAGVSFYVKIGRSEAQIFSNSFPACTLCNAVAPLPLPGESVLSGQPGFSSTVINNSSGGGAGGGAGRVIRVPVIPGVSASVNGLHDRRPLLLAVFGLLELVLLSNLTALALARRAPS